MKKVEFDKLISVLEGAGYEVCAVQESEFDEAHHTNGKTLYVRVLIPGKARDVKNQM